METVAQRIIAPLGAIMKPSAASTPTGGRANLRLGALDAAFSRWLMGFPPIWDCCSPGWHDSYFIRRRTTLGDIFHGALTCARVVLWWIAALGIIGTLFLFILGAADHEQERADSRS